MYYCGGRPFRTLEKALNLVRQKGFIEESHEFVSLWLGWGGLKTDFRNLSPASFLGSAFDANVNLELFANAFGFSQVCLVLPEPVEAQDNRVADFPFPGLFPALLSE